MYTAKVIEKIDNGKGYWNYLKIGIFKDGEQIGEYDRNYSAFFNTFFPFEQNNNWYALYSKDYTATRIMSLPDCKDIGGEERYTGGFCPTDYYVPEICIQWPPESPDDPEPTLPQHSEKWQKRIPTKTGGYRVIYPSDTADPDYSYECHMAYKAEQEIQGILLKQWNERHPFTTMTAPFGFVAGCVWGDDSSWKIQYLDLSQVHKGIIKRDDRFGYIELPDGLTLEQAISADLYSADYPYIDIAIKHRYNINTGKERT